MGPQKQLRFLKAYRRVLPDDFTNLKVWAYMLGGLASDMLGLYFLFQH